MRYLLLMLGSLSMILLLGCESGEGDGNFWREENQATAEPTAEPTTEPTATPTDSDTPPPGGATDEAPFASFSFSYGGFNGSGAALSAPRIAGLRIGGNTMSYSWSGPDLSSWGLSSSQAGAICCLFVQNSAGAWVGGKFDWISSSRTSRDLSHVRGGYNGWTLAGVPNPCRAAFVIISADGRRRSNVIAATWQR